MCTKQGDKCRLCFTPGFFHINLFTTPQKAVEIIREIFHCEVMIWLYKQKLKTIDHYFFGIY